MRIRSRRPLTAVAASLAVLMGTAACSWSGSSDAAAGDGTLTVAGPLPIENLDPHGAASMDGGTQLAARAIYSPLVTASGPGKFKGDLAAKWAPNEDATRWTFTLRSGVEYTDGTPVTAQEVAASFERVLAAKGPLAGNFGGYSVEAPDKKTVVFTSKTPDAAFLGKITSFFVTPKAAKGKGFFQKPVGSGPFQVTSFEPGQSLKLKPNSGYWNGKPDVSELEFQSVPEVSARMTAIRTGEVDVTWSMPDDQIAQLKSDTNLNVDTIPSPGVNTMWMNSSTPALEDAAVRRALWQGVDFKSIIKSLYPETGSPADSVVSPAVLGYAKQQPVKYDKAAAKAALKKGGFDFSKKIRFQFSQPNFRQFVEAVASDLSEIGVKVEPLEKEQAVFLDDLLAMKWDMNIQQIGSQGFDAATNLGRLYPCAAKRTGYCNKNLDKVLAEAGSTTDIDERKDLYAQATKTIWTDAVGMYPMFVEQPYAWRKSVKGFELSPDGMPTFEKVKVSDE
ncbi:putative D,D-dipeptide-binding periplasmic protein DdpA precursor [Streptomyces sp. YIM 130001]|uniref:ABC transporter substrate-binding protein n=1 Tax=Streptomyces sp. YIM 130001 TaxID=2259644 RepID=UPI000EC89500|nr:ABC transporter substrate-binding protein [Streptomyces sp. YIM 130001]RII17878.1 putative D,D-dipeptide-binding periplasmic protein DdpA precursor [Streptomyces sp. YIM 130001]